MAPPGTDEQFGNWHPIRTILLIGCLVMLVAGIALLVIIRRRVKLEEQEEEGHPQDTVEGEEGGVARVLNKIYDWWVQLELPSWSKKQDLIQL